MSYRTPGSHWRRGLYTERQRVPQVQATPLSLSAPLLAKLAPPLVRHVSPRRGYLWRGAPELEVALGLSIPWPKSLVLPGSKFLVAELLLNGETAPFEALRHPAPLALQSIPVRFAAGPSPWDRWNRFYSTSHWRHEQRQQFAPYFLLRLVNSHRPMAGWKAKCRVWLVRCFVAADSRLRPHQSCEPVCLLQNFAP